MIDSNAFFRNFIKKLEENMENKISLSRKMIF